MGDDMCCCGIDGLPGFKGNDYNLCMILNGKTPEPTEHMKKVGTGGVLQKPAPKRRNNGEDRKAIFLRIDARGIEPKARLLPKTVRKGQ